MTKPHSPWPPKDPTAFIRTDAFASLLMSVVTGLAGKYPHMDFADAVASLFTWFDRKATSEPGFISLERFPTLGAFRAYLRASAWNVARVTARQRLREAQISELGSNFEPVSREAGPEIIAVIQECKERLPALQRRVFELFVEDEIPTGYHCDRLPYVTAIMQGEIEHLTEDDIRNIFEEASSAIGQCVGGKQGPTRGRRH